MLGSRWNPWRALRERTHVDLRWGSLEGCDGLLVDVGGGRREVWLDERLGRVERNAVLAHELVHDERGILYCPEVPELLVVKEERAVDREVAGRLVPLEELAGFVSRCRSIDEPVTAAMVADEFDVPERVAERALRRLRHPSSAAVRAAGERAVERSSSRSLGMSW